MTRKPKDAGLSAVKQGGSYVRDKDGKLVRHEFTRPAEATAARLETTTGRAPAGKAGVKPGRENVDG